MIRAVLDELVGLFVDDGFLAAGLLAWCAAVALLATALPAALPWCGPLLLIGCASILLATVVKDRNKI